MARVLIGTSGWHYDSWRGPFFPKGLPLRSQLQFYASTVTLFIASASLLAWLGSTLPNLRRNLMPRDHLRVVSCNSTDSIVVFNDGDRDLFVSHVLLYMSGRDSNWPPPRNSRWKCRSRFR